MSSSTYGQPVSASADATRRDREKRETCLCPPPRRCPRLDFYPRNVLQRNSVACGRFLPATELKKREKPIICRIRGSQTEFCSIRTKWNSKMTTITTVKTLFLDREIGILRNLYVYTQHASYPRDIISERILWITRRWLTILWQRHSPGSQSFVIHVKSHFHIRMRKT